MQERVVVLGSNSFSGSHFVAHCLRQGLDVVGISRSPEPDPVFLPRCWEPLPDYRFQQLDLNTEGNQILELIHSHQPHYVVNFAAQGMVAQSWQEPADWYLTNSLSLIRLQHGLRKLASLRAFVQASTPEVYGNTVGVVTEDAPFNPTTPYAISKATLDMNLLAYARTFQFPAVLTRSANVCGPGQQLYRILPRAILSALCGQKMRLDGGGLSERAFIDIRDVCQATLLAARRAEPGSIYHLSSGAFVTIRALVEQVCARLDVAFDSVVELGPARVGQDAAYKLDAGRAQRELGWTPSYDLEATIEATTDWVRTNLARLRSLPQEYVHQSSLAQSA